MLNYTFLITLNELKLRKTEKNPVSLTQLIDTELRNVCIFQHKLRQLTFDRRRYVLPYLKSEFPPQFKTTQLSKIESKNKGRVSFHM